MTSKDTSKEKRWASRIPVKACTNCYEGVIIQENYEDVECTVCNGTGVQSARGIKSPLIITSQINNNLNKDANRSQH